MNYDIHIENLGAIKEADITITPMTILAGENGTGKSFVTKFLYSVLCTVNIDIYSNYIVKTISNLSSYLKQIIKAIEAIENNDEINNEFIFINNLSNTLDDTLEVFDYIGTGYHDVSDESIDELKEDLDLFINFISSQLDDFFEKSSYDSTNQPTEIEEFKSYFLKNLRGFGEPNVLLKSASAKASELIFSLENPKSSYLKVFISYITDELKENFQISEVIDLISYSSNESVFIIEGLIEVYISRTEGLTVKFLSSHLTEFQKINHILFFESPVYWRLLPMIEKPKHKAFRQDSEILNGVPKHFYDLKELLFTNFKDGERPAFIIECANKLQEQLKGKFNASNGDLTFENNQGQSISKNLVSFGMTNIGIIQAVLSKNIINKGSFVFIDEPESNLHPEWQAILANVLVHLAKNGVYVIVTTHSSDMLKAFDISTQEQEVNEELSTYYFKSDGKLLDMVDDEFTPIEKARRKLLETYENLMIRGYLL